MPSADRHKDMFFRKLFLIYVYLAVILWKQQSSCYGTSFLDLYGPGTNLERSEILESDRS